MYNSIEKLIEDYCMDYTDAIILDEFEINSNDGALGFYDEFVLYGLQNKNKNIVAYASEHYHTGTNKGCFGVRNTNILYNGLEDWNSLKRFYKSMEC